MASNIFKIRPPFLRGRGGFSSGSIMEKEKINTIIHGMNKWKVFNGTVYFFYREELLPFSIISLLIINSFWYPEYSKILLAASLSVMLFRLLYSSLIKVIMSDVLFSMTQQNTELSETLRKFKCMVEEVIKKHEEDNKN